MTAYPCLLSGLVSLPQFLQPVVLLLLQIRVLLDLGLVKSIDDRVLALVDQNSLDLQPRHC